MNIRMNRWHVIDNGSSATRIVPNLLANCQADDKFHPLFNLDWPNFATKHTKDGGNFKYTDGELKEFEDSEKLLAYPRNIAHDSNKPYRGLQYGTQEDEFFHIMIDRVNANKEMEEALTRHGHLSAVASSWRRLP